MNSPDIEQMFLRVMTFDLAKSLRQNSNSSTTQFEIYDEEHVRNFHPRIEKLFYRERHHKKLERGLEDVQGIQRATTGSVISEDIATDFQTPNIEFESTSSNPGISQTSYSPSLVDGGQVTEPPPRRDSVGGKPFECPYCFFIIDTKARGHRICTSSKISNLMYARSLRLVCPTDHITAAVNGIPMKS